LNASICPHDSIFFLSQTRYTMFDELIAASVRASHLPVEWAVFLWHILGIFLLLLGAWQVGRAIFAEPAAQWAGAGLLAMLMIVPVAATQVFLVEQYLHPRTLALAALLFAQAAALERKRVTLVWLAAGAMIHPTVTLFGAFHLGFQFLTWPGQKKNFTASAAMMLPVASDAWHVAIESRWFLFPLRWPWYQWVGVFAPLGLLAWFSRIGRAAGNEVLERLPARLAVSGVLGVFAALAITTWPSLEIFIPAEPMRSLHFPILMTVLLGGGLLGKMMLRNKPARWTVVFVSLGLLMFFVQHSLHAGSAHIEWPGGKIGNSWAESFEWIRRNTPQDALFALNPRYTRLPGEDGHSFRALAERSMLADERKDCGVVCLVPDLAPVWLDQVNARQGWTQFGIEDFRRLKKVYGVGWVVLEQPLSANLDCPYANARVRVCRIE
jgi:hypothetical protein